MVNRKIPVTLKRCQYPGVSFVSDRVTGGEPYYNQTCEEDVRPVDGRSDPHVSHGPRGPRCLWPLSSRCRPGPPVGSEVTVSLLNNTEGSLHFNPTLLRRVSRDPNSVYPSSSRTLQALYRLLCPVLVPLVGPTETWGLLQT